MIGRSDSCDLALPSESVSRVHCVIDARPDGWWVQDRSRHGTEVNDTKIDESRALSEKDEIAIGMYRATFSLTEDARLYRKPPGLARNGGSTPLSRGLAPLEGGNQSGPGAFPNPALALRPRSVGRIFWYRAISMNAAVTGESETMAASIADLVSPSSAGASS